MGSSGKYYIWSVLDIEGTSDSTSCDIKRLSNHMGLDTHSSNGSALCWVTDCIIFKTWWGNTVSNDYICWKSWGSNLGSGIVSTLNRKVLVSNLGRNKGAVFSTTSDELQPTPSLQLNVNQGFSSGSKVPRGLSHITHIHLVPILKFSGAILPFNLSASMAHIGTLL